MKKSLFLLAVITLLTSCRTPDGEINVGQPQVFSRERLMAQRQQELQWAKQQLAKADELDYTSAEYLSSAAKRRDLMNFLALSIKPNTSTTASDAANVNGTTGPKVTDISMFESSTTDASGNKTTTTSNILNEKKITQLPVTQSNAKLSPIEEIKRKKAYRDFLNSYIKDAMLDDFHDANGYVLYELNFDVSIVPNSNDNFAQIEFALPNIQSVELKNLYKKWKDALQTRVETSFFQLAAVDKSKKKKIIEDYIKSKELFVFQLPYETKRVVTINDYKTLPINELVIMYCKQKDNKKADDDIQNVLFSRIVEENLRFQYENEYVTISVDIDANGDLKNVTAKEKSEDKFISKIKVLNDTHRPYVLKITPSEINELGSETSSLEDNLILAAMIEATYKSMAIKNETIYKNIEQLSTHALKENTLSLSYKTVDGFGLILGPRTIIDDYRPTFAHKPRYYNYSVMVAVPAWYPRVQLNVTSKWKDLDDDVRSPWFLGLRRFTEFIGMINKANVTTDKQITFNVEENALALNDSFVREIRYVDRKPRVGSVEGPSKVYAEEAFQVLIQGENLWRNTAVYLDGIAAIKLDTTPDMNGIAATFVIPKQAVFGKSDGMNLRVFTSEGSYDTDKKIQVYPPRSIMRFIECNTDFIVKDSKSWDLDFEVDKKLIPQGFYGIKIILQTPEGKNIPTTTLTDGKISLELLKQGKFSVTLNKDEFLKATPNLDEIIPRIEIIATEGTTGEPILKGCQVDVLTIETSKNDDVGTVTFLIVNSEQFNKYKSRTTFKFVGNDNNSSDVIIKPDITVKPFLVKCENKSTTSDYKGNVIMMIDGKEVCKSAEITIKKVKNE